MPPILTASLAVPLVAFLNLATPMAVSGGGCGAPAAAPAVPGYYDIELVTTGRVPGSRGAAGIAVVTSARSPFGISLAPDGAYRHELAVRVEGMRGNVSGRLAVWVTTPDIDQVRLLGSLEPGVELRGEVAWNKFLVVVTLEPELAAGASAWAGPIVLRGASRSGRMHTMAGHGPYQSEPCVKYGY